jgi:hypothetical protein
MDQILFSKLGVVAICSSPINLYCDNSGVMCTRLGSTCSKLLWPDLLIGSANLINCRCVTW